MNIKRTLRISRPRFWIYELGSFLVGFASYAHFGSSSWYSFDFLVFFIYFTFSANLYIYGINDIFDYETDIQNPKKTDYESLVVPSERPKLFLWIALTTLPFILLSFFLNISKESFVAFLLFLFFAGFYSAPPIRAKTKPFLDSFFSGAHYIVTAVFGYYLAGGSSFPLLPVIASMFWAIAMHAYSAVPDIKADKEGGLQTIATFCGKRVTLIFCITLYVLSSAIAFLYYPLFAIGGFIIYSFLMILSLQTKSEDELFKLYTYFPKINTIIGMILFFLIFLSK